MPQILKFLALFLLLLPGACATGNVQLTQEMHDQLINPPPYRLSKGDVVKIVVHDEEGLKGNYTLDESGRIDFPLIGSQKIGGHNLAEIRKILTERLAEGYLVEPDVRVKLEKTKPVYVIGEVVNPGPVSYQTGLNVLQIVSDSGGYSLRANKNRIFLTRPSWDLQRTPVPLHTKTRPGDVIEVPERFF